MKRPRDDTGVESPLLQARSRGDAKCDAQASTKTQPAANTHIESKGDAQASTKTQPAASTHIESKGDAQASTKTRPATSTHIESKGDAQASTKTQPAASTHIESKGDAQASTKTQPAESKGDAQVSTKTQPAANTRPEGGTDEPPWRPVPGFECKVRWHGGVKKLPKTQSWVFVPLFVSALRTVSWCPNASSDEQIERAQAWWRDVFSRWDSWVLEVRRVLVGKHGSLEASAAFLWTTKEPKWTTSLVYRKTKEYGKVPHPSSARQDRVIELLPCDIQNEIFASVITLSAE